MGVHLSGSGEMNRLLEPVIVSGSKNFLACEHNLALENHMETPKITSPDLIPKLGEH